MREIFDVMSSHPKLTIFLGVIFYLSISEIVKIFYKK